MPDSYLLVKSLHVLAIIVFYGNVLITAWWKTRANRSGSPQVIAFALRQITLSDILFTGSASVVILVTGVGNAHMHDILPWESTWMMWGLALFALSGIIWGSVMIPIQIKQTRLSQHFDADGKIPEEYWRLERIWSIAGAFNKVLPLIVVFIMVFKPE